MYRLEAREDGVGITPVRIAKCEYHKDGSGYRCLESISDFRRLVVLRHNGSEGKDEELEERILELSGKYIGLEYPALRELSWAGTRIRPLRWLYDKTLGLVDGVVGRHVINPGPYCSMLIALMYRELGLRLFDPDRDPRTISPNALLRSNLRRVPEIICTEDVSIQNNEDLMRELNHERETWPRERVLAPLVRGKMVLTVAQRFLELVESFDKIDPGETKAGAETVTSRTAFHLDCTPVIPACGFKCAKCIEEMKAVFGGIQGVSAFYREGDGVVVEHDASVIAVHQLLDIFRGLPSFYQNHFIPSLMATPGRQG